VIRQAGALDVRPGPAADVERAREVIAQSSGCVPLDLRRPVEA